ncbi:MAG: hypothetical protein AAGL92_05370 [Pseudomonadota bacterium]
MDGKIVVKQKKVLGKLIEISSGKEEQVVADFRTSGNSLTTGAIGWRKFGRKFTGKRPSAFRFVSHDGKIDEIARVWGSVLGIGVVVPSYVVFGGAATEPV